MDAFDHGNRKIVMYLLLSFFLKVSVSRYIDPILLSCSIDLWLAVKHVFKNNKNKIMYHGSRYMPSNLHCPQNKTKLVWSACRNIVVKQIMTLLQPVNFRVQILDHGRFHHLLVNLKEDETTFNFQLVTSEKKVCAL